MNPTSQVLLSSNPPLAEAFRAGMRRLAAGVCVVTGAVSAVSLGEAAAALVYRDGAFHPLPAVQAEGSASTA